MICLSPIWLPETSERFGQYIPCNKCYSCLQKKRSIWTFRMMQENKVSTTGYFITLTYDEENIPLIDQWNWTIPTLYPNDLTNFIKRLRNNVDKYTTEDPKPKLRYFSCGEYGKKGDRPHYHIILWNFPEEFIEWDPIHKVKYSELLEDTWKKGIVDIGEVEQASCHYVAKYTLDPLTTTWLDQDNRIKPFARMSRRPGIGSNYCNDEIKNFYHNNKNCYASLEGNIKQPIGRYLKEKIYQDNPEAKKEMERKIDKFTRQYEDSRRLSSEDGRTGQEAIEHNIKITRDTRANYQRKLKKLNKTNPL